jgi:hypothetical protein
MKGKISSTARRILADRDASGKLMNYVVHGKEGSIIVNGQKYGVKTEPVLRTKKVAKT